MPIPGTTKLHRLEENIGAAAVALNIHDLADIGDAASKKMCIRDRCWAKAEPEAGTANTWGGKVPQAAWNP